MSDLETLERLFWESMRQEPAPAAALAAVAAKGALPAEARLGIYRTAYWVRQVGALREAFPSVVAELGDGPFARAASRYLQQHPSRSWALEHLGRQFPEYLAAQGDALLAQLAALDLLRMEALIAPDCEAVPIEALDPERFAETTLQVGPHVGAVQLSAEAATRLAAPLAGAFTPDAHLCVWREHHSVLQRWISNEEAMALKTAQQQVQFVDVCETLGGGKADATGAQHAFDTLRAWFARGWVSVVAPRRLLGVLALCVLTSAASGCNNAPEPCNVPNSADLAPGEVTGALMRPGQNCLRCHSASGLAAEKPFSVGGTVFAAADDEACGGVEGVVVRVTDSEGKKVELRTNSVGNFFSAEPLTPPLSMEAEYQGRTAVMPVTAPTGGCALCHSWPDAVEADGRIRAP